MNLSDFSRLGGKARAANMTAEQRRQSASAAARAGWAKMTPKQRSKELKRRAGRRALNRLGAQLDKAGLYDATEGER